MIISKKIPLVVLSILFFSLRVNPNPLTQIDFEAVRDKEIILNSLDSLMKNIDNFENGLGKDNVSFNDFKKKSQEISRKISKEFLGKFWLRYTADEDFEKKLSEKLSLLVDKFYEKLKKSGCENSFINKAQWQNATELLDYYFENKRNFQQRWYKKLCAYTVDPLKNFLSIFFPLGKDSIGFLWKYKVGKLAVILFALYGYNNIPFLKEIIQPIISQIALLFGITSEDPTWSEWFVTSTIRIVPELPQWAIILMLWNFI